MRDFVLGDFAAVGYDPVTPVLATWDIRSEDRHFEHD